MTISISLVVLFAIGMVVLFKYAGLKLLQAIICTLFGFLLATTGLADPVRDLLDAFVAALARLI